MQFIDSLERNILINFPPKRIISLVPSITELLFDLDLNKEIIGVSSFCIYPEKAISKINYPTLSPNYYFLKVMHRRIVL